MAQSQLPAANVEMKDDLFDDPPIANEKRFKQLQQKMAKARKRPQQRGQYFNSDFTKIDRVLSAFKSFANVLSVTST